MRFNVLGLDVARNNKQLLGWMVIDRHLVGTIDISDEALDDDRVLLDVLNGAGYTELAIEDVYFMGDLDRADIGLELREEETERPILALVYQQ